MRSRTKFLLDDSTVRRLFERAGIVGVTSIAPLGAGEYNAVYEAKADRPYVLKIAPKSTAAVLTHEKGMMRSEVFWYSLIRERTAIRVPEVYYSDFTRELIPADWFIMEKLPGSTLDALGLSEEERAAAERAKVQMAAQLHSVHNAKFGYIQNEQYDDWYQAIRAMVSNLIADGRCKGRGSRRGRRLLRYIDRYKDVLAAAPCSMVNFDIWDPNIIATREADGELQYAWIDPERSMWGDRLMDFCCFEMFTSLEDKAATIEAYNTVAELPVTASREEQLRCAFAQALMGLIMEIEKYYRYTPLHFGWWRNVAASVMLFKQAFVVLSR